MLTDEQLRQMMLEAAGNGGKLIDHVMTFTNNPVDGLLALIVATAALAKDMEMPLETLQAGVLVAYNTLPAAEATHELH